MQRLEAVLADFPARGAALCFIDLDRFKTLNDTFGHAAGDEALLTVARRLRVMVGPDDVVARFAGDEFVMLVVGRSEAELHAMLTLTINVVGAPIPLPSVSQEGAEALVITELGASVGVSTLRAGMGAEEAIQRADTAMYESKRTGGDSYTFASPEGADRRAV
jgi:diguanylate cyclase (GGDEF)-like protein